MGVKGAYCDRLLENGENFCLSNPCWNGGICRSTGYSYVCDCAPGYSGSDCRTVSAATVAPQVIAITYPPQVLTTQAPVPITFPPVPVTPTPAIRTTQAFFLDKKVIVTNRGGYTATLQLQYYNPTKTVQTGSITSGQSYAFYIPGDIDYSSGPGAYLEVYANGGNRVLAKQIYGNPECIDVWGGTLNPQWSNVNC